MGEEKSRVKNSEDKFIRISALATRDEFKAISERAQKGELKYGYYAIDNDKGYHYYLVIQN